MLYEVITILKHVTNPLTNERSYRGKDMPLVSFDLIDGADYVEITCSPKALGSVITSYSIHYTKLYESDHSFRSRASNR